MWNILRRSFPLLAVNFMVAAAGLAAVRILIGPEMNSFFAMGCGLTVFLFVLLTLTAEEQYEEKHHGYALLAVLPVKDLEIVASKFLMSLAAAAAIWGFVELLFLTVAASPEAGLVVRGYFLAAAGVSLVTAGLFYIGIFGIGFTRFAILALTATTAMGLIPSLIMRSGSDRVGMMIDRLLDWLGHMDRPLFLTASLLIYLAAFAVAGWIKGVQPSA